MKKYFRLLFFFITFSTTAFSQTKCPCCTPQHMQFDFWVGDWDVFDTLGTKIGENLIVKLEDSCIVNEHWNDGDGGTGRSYNYYDQADSTWNQVWVDNKGGSLVLKGKLEGGKMILQSKLLKGIKMDWYSNRITWTPNKDGSVTQLWEILDKYNKVIATTFKGVYKKKQ